MCVSLRVWMMSGSVTAAWHLCCFSDGVMFVASGREKQLLRVEEAVRSTVSKLHSLKKLSSRATEGIISISSCCPSSFFLLNIRTLEVAKIILVDLAVPWGNSCQEVHKRKASKYQLLVSVCRDGGRTARLFPLSKTSTTGDTLRFLVLAAKIKKNLHQSYNYCWPSFKSKLCQDTLQSSYRANLP